MTVLPPLACEPPLVFGTPPLACEPPLGVVLPFVFGEPPLARITSALVLGGVWLALRKK